jgi:hypothetical protein
MKAMAVIRMRDLQDLRASAVPAEDHSVSTKSLYGCVLVMECMVNGLIGSWKARTQ